MSVQSIVLNNTTNGASKTYHASIEKSGDGFLVNFAYGRIGNTLKSGTKTQNPVPLKEAESIYEKLVNSKIKKNYQAADGEATAFTKQCEMVHSGIDLQLSNEIDDSRLEELFKDSRYAMQRKYDGQRRAIKAEHGKVKGINKKGQYVPLQQAIAEELESFIGLALDGEIIGDRIYAFDLLTLNGQDYRSMQFSDRMVELEILVNRYGFEHITAVKTAYTEEDKRALFNLLKDQGHEGVVFKRIDKAYQGGKPNKGGDHLKYKNWKTASVIVTAHNQQRSVQIAVLNDKCDQIICGNVPIPSNEDIPNLGSVIEVRYLYAFKESGMLFIPSFKEKRTTVEVDECLVSQLHYKPQ